MVRVSFVIVAVLQELPLWQMTRDAIKSCNSQLPVGIEQDVVGDLVLVVNRQPAWHPTIIRNQCIGQSKLMRSWQTCIDGQDRHCAGGWNHGINLALESDPDLILVLNNDAELLPGCLDELVRFGMDPVNASVAAWSSWDSKHQGEVTEPVDGCDFSCFMIRPGFVDKHGYFDENLRPVYWEDNDMYCRIILGGEHCRVVRTARHLHHGSRTLHLDGERQHHIRHWFEVNKDYFCRKWLVPGAATCEEDVLLHYAKNPFGDETKPLWHWERPAN